MNVEKLDYICDYCKTEIIDINDLGYYGSKNRQDTSCSPFLEMLTLCKNCEKIRNDNTFYYSGIGSRKTPENILVIMREVAKKLAKTGFTLRSGGADGADMAFEQGCDEVGGKKEIYLPWKKFNKNFSPLFDISEEAFKMSEKYHPAWSACSDGAKRLHARNCYQVLGSDLKTPSLFILCWTWEDKGGTLQACRIATDYGIPIINIKTHSDPTLESVVEKVNSTLHENKI